MKKMIFSAERRAVGPVGDCLGRVELAGLLK